jgi:hypothetical protein
MRRVIGGAWTRKGGSARHFKASSKLLGHSATQSSLSHPGRKAREMTAVLPELTVCGGGASRRTTSGWVRPAPSGANPLRGSSARAHLPLFRVI